MLNPHRLTKAQHIWLWEHRCKKHCKPFSEHPSCFLKEAPDESPISERVGYFDIEATGLNANWDYILSYALKVDGMIYGRVLTKAEVLDWRVLDKDLVRELCSHLRTVDRVIVHYGRDRRFDLPFVRTRALRWRVDFPLYKQVLVTDNYDVAKNKLKLHSYRLEAICQFLEIPAKTHPMKPAMWQKAKLGDGRALDYIWRHNVEDVVSLKLAYERVEGFVRKVNTSI